MASFLSKLESLLPQLRDVIRSIRKLEGEYLLLINSVDINVYEDPDKIIIRDSDTLTFVPIVHGGTP